MSVEKEARLYSVMALEDSQHGLLFLAFQKGLKVGVGRAEQW